MSEQQQEVAVAAAAAAAEAKQPADMGSGSSCVKGSDDKKKKTKKGQATTDSAAAAADGEAAAKAAHEYHQPQGDPVIVAAPAPGATVVPPPAYTATVAAAGAGGAAGAVAAPQYAAVAKPKTTAVSDVKPSASHPVVAITAAASQLKDRVKVVIWDFDLTVLCIHSFGSRVTEAAVRSGVRKLEDDFEDLHMFLSLVQYLLDSGIQVAIASFGLYDVIQAYMDVAFGPDQKIFHRANISTPGSVGASDGCSLASGKNDQLAGLCQYFGVKPHEVMFFDDDRRNIDLSVRAGYSHSYMCSHPFGLELWAEAVKDFE